MGYDPMAYRVINRRQVFAYQISYLKKRFGEAAAEVRKLAGMVDAGFEPLAWLDCTASVIHLVRGLGFRKPQYGTRWSSREVQRLSRRAKWKNPAKIPVDELVYYWSARKFFEVCVKYRLGIIFT